MNLLHDIRYALRQLAARPGFTLVAALTLAAGIAASTAIFTVAYGVLLAPLPYEEPERLAQVVLVDRDNGEVMEYLTGLDFLDIRENVPAFESVACSYNYRETGFNLETSSGVERVRSQQISSEFFDVYGVEPLLGRAFTPAEEREGVPVAILSEELWQRRFEGDRSVIGRLIRADGVGLEIVGVMPADFEGVHASDVDVWIPHNTAPGGSNHRANYYITVIGRLAEGVSLAVAEEQIAALRARLAADELLIADLNARVVALTDRVVGGSRELLYALLAAAGLVLLIACANLATLLLVRASERRRELATRAALGSSRLRLVRQLLTENLTLAALGGLAGMALGFLAVEGLVAIAPAALPRIDNVAFDWRIFGAGCVLTVFTAILFGLIPSLRASRVDLESALRESSRGGSAGVAQQRLQQGLVVMQVALAVVVLFGAGLLTRSFGQLLRADLGIAPENVLVFEVSLPATDYPEGADRARFHRRLQERIETAPGVAAAGATSWLPASGRYNRWGYAIPGGDRQGDMHTDVRVVQGSYFDALGVQLLKGRRFGPEDRAGAAPVVIVSRSFARRHWPDSSAIGKTISGLGGEERTIVGVVRDTRYDHRVAASVKTYIPHEQFADDRNWALTQVVKASADPELLRGAIEAELAAIDPTLVVHHVRELEEIVAGAIARERFAMLLMAAFGWTALFLAVVGIHGVTSYVVAKRTREIGIRLALGAAPRRLLAAVLRQGLQPVVLGAGIGLAASFAAGRALAGLLFGVTAHDLPTLSAAGAVLLIAAALACYWPARRAAAVPPMTALRHE